MTEAIKIPSGPACVVPQCKNRFQKQGISFHQFPRDKDLCRQWLTKLKFPKLPKGAFICGAHFAEEDFKVRDHTGKKYTRLKKLAVPTLNLPSFESIPIKRKRKKLKTSFSQNERKRAQRLAKLKELAVLSGLPVPSFKYLKRTRVRRKVSRQRQYSNPQIPGEEFSASSVDQPLTSLQFNYKEICHGPVYPVITEYKSLAALERQSTLPGALKMKTDNNPSQVLLMAERISELPVKNAFGGKVEYQLTSEVTLSPVGSADIASVNNRPSSCKCNFALGTNPNSNPAVHICKLSFSCDCNCTFARKMF